MANNNDEEKKQSDAGISDLFASMIELGDATTKFTINQMQNAVGVLTDPGKAIGIVKESIDSVSKAMSHATVKPGEDDRTDVNREVNRAENAAQGNAGQGEDRPSGRKT